MPNVTNSLPTANGRSPNFGPIRFWPGRQLLALDFVLLTKVYCSYSTNIVRVLFTPVLQPTLKRDLKCKSNLQINVNSPAMANLHNFLCYHSLEHLDPFLDEFLTFIHSTLSSLSFFPAISSVLPEGADGNFNDPWILQCILHTNSAMCNHKTNEFFPRRGLVKT